ncbi:MAG: hypothetical protein ACK4L4_13105 [Gemmobacter sp.]
MRTGLLLAAMVSGGAGTATGQQFTTAAEVRPILEMTKANWVAVREYDGQDLLYFTHLLAWRCGMNAVRFSVNTANVDHEWPLEPCYEGTASPNAIKAETHPPFTAFPLGSVGSVVVVVELDDGSFLPASYERAQILLP